MSSILAPVQDIDYKNGNLDFYGAVELDAETGEIVWRFDSTAALEVPRLYDVAGNLRTEGFHPSSVERLADGRTMIAGYKSVVWVDAEGNLDRREQHESLNSVHEVQKTSSGTYILASTGMDMILEFDDDWNLVWQWNMWEHVDPTTRPSNYYPNQYAERDVRHIPFEPDDRYHLNYVTELEGDRLLCSALNYGVFTVDRETGGVISAFTDVEETHNPVVVDEDIVVCESGKNRVVRTDMDQITDVLFEGGLSFVKDADPIPGSDDWLITDTKNHRALIWNETEPAPKREYRIGVESNPYEADYLVGDRTNA